MQERSYTLPMCSVGHTSHIPSTVTNDTHTTSTILSNDFETGTESSTSTPELNLLLDKLTEILRFRSGCRRHFGVLQQQPPQPQESSLKPTTNLKRLQTSNSEPLHNTEDVLSRTLNASSTSSGAWKSSNIHYKSSISNRSSHHHHKHHSNFLNNLNNIERKRRLPSLLQRLIDDGNLIKEAVHRLKTQRFSHTFKQEQQQTNTLNTPSTPTTKTSNQLFSNLNLPQQINDSPTQITSSPNRGISWFLSSSVFGVNSSTTNHNSGSRSPLRTYYSSTTYDRAPMEIGIHDG